MESERLSYFTKISGEMCDEFLPIVLAKTWKRWPLKLQEELSLMLTTIATDVETVRSQFDDVVWRGHDDGSVKRSVTSVRTRTQHKSKPGRPAPTAQEIRAKALAKKGITLVVAEEETEEVEAEAPAE